MKDESEDNAMECDAATATKSVKMDVLLGLMVSRGSSIFSVSTLVAALQVGGAVVIECGVVW